MTSKFSNQVISSINNDVLWEKWSETARCALSAALMPAIYMTQNQKGASDEEWDSVRLMRHLFNTGRLPLPSFIIKQWSTIPDCKIEYWREIGKETRNLILEKTKKRKIKTEH